ncbi:M16 family metallopeptidase [Candidatus Omnitrophota bacterium]
MYKKNVLKNGLRVVTCSMPKRESVGLGIWIGTGGRYEHARNKGVAHFLEHLLFKGTKHYSNRQIKESIEGIGGMLNAFTSEEHTCYLVKIPKRYVDSSLKILSDMVRNPLLKTSDIERERTVIIEEIKMYHDLPREHVQEALEALLWPNHPLGMTIAGSIESVSGLSRKDIVQFKQAFYHPKNIAVVACGDLEHRKFVNSVARIFSKEDPSEKIACLKAQSIQDKARVQCIHKDIEQTHISLGLHGLHRDHKDLYGLGLLNIILGANMSSRLFHELREKRGLAYAVGSYVRAMDDAGIFGIRAGVDNKKVIESIATIIKELNKLVKERISTKELSRAKEYYVGQLTIALEDTLDHMVFAGEAVTSLDKIHTLKHIAHKIKKVNTADLTRIASSIIHAKGINLAVIGPFSKKQEAAVKNLIGV